MQLIFFLHKRLVENPQLATAKWSNQKYGKQTQVRPRSDPGMTWTRFKPMNEVLPSYPYQALLAPSMATDYRGTPLIDRLGLLFQEMPHRQPYQDMVEFLKEAGDAIRSFHATQAGAYWFTTQIHYIQRGYGICCKRNKPILALTQR